LEDIPSITSSSVTACIGLLATCLRQWPQEYP
jgi:hypothetical protein